MINFTFFTRKSYIYSTFHHTVGIICKSVDSLFHYHLCFYIWKLGRHPYYPDEALSEKRNKLSNSQPSMRRSDHYVYCYANHAQ